MDNVKQLVQIDWWYVVIEVLLLLAAAKFVWSLFDWFFVEKLGIETKKMRQRRLEQEELKVKNNRVFDLQEIAPKVNVSFNLEYATMDWTERGNFSWDVSLGINVTDFFCLEKDVVSKVYDLEMIALEKRRELLLEEQSYEKSFYEEMIEENEKNM